MKCCRLVYFAMIAMGMDLHGVVFQHATICRRKMASMIVARYQQATKI